MVGVPTELRPFPCLNWACKKSFTRKSDLNRHDLTHLGKKERDLLMLRCTFPPCSRKFLQPSNLWVHIKKHLGIKDMKCPMCPYETGDPSEFTRHKKTNHNYQPEKRLIRQRNNGSTCKEAHDESESEDEGTSIDIDASESLESPTGPQTVASTSGTSSNMDIDTPSLDLSDSVGADVDIGIVPFPPHSPTSTGSPSPTSNTPPPSLVLAPLCVASPPRRINPGVVPLPSPSLPSQYLSMLHSLPPRMRRRLAGHPYLPSPPRSPSPRTLRAATSLLGLPAEVFITGSRDCQLPPIMTSDD